MPKRKSPRSPTSTLANTLIVPASNETRRLVTRLSKPTLSKLVQSWLDPDRVELYAPDLSDPEDESEEISLEEATENYSDLSRSSSIRGKDIAERMLEREWRDGFTLLGIAELEWNYLVDHPTSQKWSAQLLSPIGTSSQQNPQQQQQPHFFVPTFLQTLSTSLIPHQTSHFFTHAHPTLPLTLIRISLHDPHSPLSYPNKRKLFWLCFPSGGDHIFTTLTAAEGLREIVTSAIATALSRSRARFELKPGRFVARTLESMMAFRGVDKASGGLAGGWGVYVDGFETNPLAPAKEVALSTIEADSDPAVKRRKLLDARFGEKACQPVESVLFEVQEKYPEKPGEVEDEDREDEGGVFRPNVAVRFEGSNVFMGVRGLAEQGVVDIDKMPGWLTGEEAVTSGVVRDGKVLRKKGGARFSRA